MEEALNISTFCKTLACFCGHLQRSSEALKESLQRRPIPLDSASSTFIQCLNRRVTSASSDLNLLESMAFGTVSFEELLGHCNELYKKNQTDLIQLEDRLKTFGYIPVEIDEGNELPGFTTPIAMKSKTPGFEDNKMDFLSFSCEPMSMMKRIEEDPLFDDSLSLQNLGISDVCLANLASEVKGAAARPGMMSLDRPINFEEDDDEHGAKKQCQTSSKILDVTGGKFMSNNQSDEGAATGAVVSVSKEDYDNLPSYMKSLASWEDMSAAVEKMNENLRKQEKPKDSYRFYQDELTKLELGPKVRSYLLLLLRMNRLVVETVDGSIVYRVL